MDNNLEGIKNEIQQIIESKKEEIIGLGEKIYNNPETGFKEVETVFSEKN